MPLVAQLVSELAPDIVCLQETKVQDADFPANALMELGFPHIIFRGEKSYNGVAILSKLPLTDIEKHTFGGNDDSRHISCRLPHGIELHNVYVPAGGDIPDPQANPKFKHKLQFVDDMTTFFGKRTSHDPLVIVGDMNIAPLEHDVWSHKQLLTVVSHTPIEVEKLDAFRDSLRWVDTHRHFVPENEKLYSWWSYRNRDWTKSDRGRRLDHIWVTPCLEDRLHHASILRPARSWDKPSDHVPIITELAL